MPLNSRVSNSLAVVIPTITPKNCCGIAKATKLNEQKSNYYDKGRLKMIDIQSFNASLKMKWIQIYLNTEDKDNWKAFFFITTQRDTAGYYCSSVHNLKQKDALQLKIKDPF